MKAAIPLAAQTSVRFIRPISNELIVEPFETNSLRQIEQVSQITGLEEPKLAFTFGDDKPGRNRPANSQ